MAEPLARGLVVCGSRNVFTVRGEDGLERECRIKGKHLKLDTRFYNPLAPGDWVRFEASGESGKGLILDLDARRNYFTRFNQKGSAVQVLAANLDYVLCVSTLAAPPFRPRFLDRAVLQCDIAGIEPLIVCNKIDLRTEKELFYERFADFARQGYTVLYVSVQTGEGIDELRRLIAGKVSVMIGQSGVGKTSLALALAPDSGLKLKTGALNEKYGRGNHVTIQGRLLSLSSASKAPHYIEEPLLGTSETGKLSSATPQWGGALIDTPGIRRFVPDGIGPQDLITYMRDFAPYAGTCAYGMSCSHQNEAGCKVQEALAHGAILPDRYESYVRLYEELSTL
ncbi:ribosome small subunit-dependent GTPase A [Breznakiellaceae bacterium SP9]